MIFRKIWSYLTFRRQGSGSNTNLKLMHGINKISIFLFLIAIVVMLIRFCS
ncbi:MAG: hypothetical protein JNL57_08100 [Bacteroidetes bacterium]|nr:hypothetical protein [Bacteroidota bacterium]